MKRCNKCKTDRNPEDFLNDKKTKALKTCLSCRETVRIWRKKNKEQISSYNKFYNDKNKHGEKVVVVLGKKVGDDVWQEFESQQQAGRDLGLHAPNINKVIKGILKTTGGYQFKTEERDHVKSDKKWEEIKTDNNYVEKCKGQPSNHRVLHETIDNIIGKKCCKCKEWTPLDGYNYSKSHWDKLRNDCKLCLYAYNKKNRKRITKQFLIYEKNRKKTDPNFKLLKTLRSRIGTALTNIKQGKLMNTMDLVGCNIDYLKNHLETHFTEGMTWQNHGEWHVDHIVPCCSFDLTKKINQQVCFNWINLQPMWGKENQEKSGKFEQIHQNILHKKVTKSLIGIEILKKVKIIH